jgi:predicted RNase H-like nuclease
LDVAITPAHQSWCFEIHPEVCFCAWNNGTAIEFEKDSDQGRQARESLIDTAWPGVGQTLLAQLQQQGHNRQHVALDDVNDAFAAIWTARRIAAGQAQRIPDAPRYDARGLRMEMWY